MASETLELLSQPNRERLSDQIAKQIKKLIFSKKIEAGQKLPTERELANTLGVSRVVVREALRSLEQAGLVEILPGHTGGSYVSNKVYKPLFDSIYDLIENGDLTLRHFYQAREIIEVSSMRLAVEQVTAKDIAELEQINERLLGDLANNEEFPFNNMKFHMKIADMSQNPLLKLIVGALLSMLKLMYPLPMQSPQFIQATYDRHIKIIEALKRKDVSLSAQLISEDVGYTKEIITDSDLPER